MQPVNARLFLNATKCFVLVPNEWYMNALNEGHGYRKKDNRDVYQQAVILFFEEYL